VQELAARGGGGRGDAPERTAAHTGVAGGPRCIPLPRALLFVCVVSLGLALAGCATGEPAPSPEAPSGPALLEGTQPPQESVPPPPAELLPGAAGPEGAVQPPGEEAASAGVAAPPATVPPAGAPLPPLPAQVGERAIAVESIDCRLGGDADVLLMVGEVARTDAAETEIVASQRFAAKYSPAASGVDTTDWWCVPKKRYCYQEVPFTAWRGEHRAGDSLVVPTAETFHVDWGIERSLRSAAQAACRS